MGLTGEAFTLNPAHLSNVQGWFGSLHYAMPYHEKALSQSFFNLAFGNWLGALGLQAGVSGSRQSAFRRLSLSYARTFGNKVSAGMGYSVLQHKLTDSYLSGFLVAGVEYRPDKAWCISFSVQNPEQQKITYPMAIYPIPSVVWIAARVQLHAMAALLLEWEKDFDWPEVWKSALVLTPHPRLVFTLGASGKPLRLSAGAGASWNRLHIHVGASHHQWMGITSAASLSYSWAPQLFKP